MAILKTLTINGVTYSVTPVVPASSVTLLASEWKGDGDAYSQVVEVPGVTAHTKVDLQPTSDQLAEFHYKVLTFVAENDGGKVTVYAIGDKPADNHTLQITKTEVEGTGKIRGNTVGTSMPRPDWNQTDPSKADYIKNKPDISGGTGGGANINDNTTSTTATWSSQKINEELAKIASYKEINIDSLSVSPSVAEIGSTVSTAAVTWNLNKVPKTLTLAGTSLTPAQSGTKNYSSVSSDRSWTLTATDDKGATASKTITLPFHNGVYYGVGTARISYDSNFVRGLTKTLRGSKLPSFSVNAGDNEYIYYCLPTRNPYGSCNFTVNGFTGGFTLVDTISFTNASGYTENYYIYRSDNANLGSTAVTVS